MVIGRQLSVVSRLGALLFLASCAATTSTAPISLEPVEFDDLPAWQQCNPDAALDAFKQSCRKFSSHPHTIPAQVAGEDASPLAWNNACLLAENTEDADSFFTTHFTPYLALAEDSREDGLLTGYYEPLLHGSLTPDATYRYPIWSVPSDLQAGVPYLTHREIDEQRLAGKATPLLYVSDYVDHFFLQIQGSGIVQLPDGEKVKVAFAGKNNRAYTAIGKYLMDNNIVPRSEMSAPRLKAWLRANPEEAQQVMWMNESYVFFQMGDNATAAVGAQGVPLTPEASIAVDPTMLPYGVPVLLDTTLPYTNEKYRRLVVTQDTGGAIKGPLRADLFFGPGERAAHLAGGMKQSAKFFVLLPK
jgi:membrane-bound lytic murein transglycosylase A